MRISPLTGAILLVFAGIGRSIAYREYEANPADAASMWIGIIAEFRARPVPVQPSRRVGGYGPTYSCGNVFYREEREDAKA